MPIRSRPKWSWPKGAWRCGGPIRPRLPARAVFDRTPRPHWCSKPETLDGSIRAASPRCDVVDVGGYLAWTRGVLAFDGMPLGDVVLTLERWYNVEIRIADNALAARRLTATFQSEPIDLVLQRIALTLGLRVERVHGSVLLLRNGS